MCFFLFGLRAHVSEFFLVILLFKRGGGVGGMDWGFEIGICTLRHME